ncbi:MAG: deaminase [Chloroflexota bacterium]|nr:deaminase [Chloroflexota bacterium]
MTGNGHKNHPGQEDIKGPLPSSDTHKSDNALDQDDFLIIGFTGAFCSGATTAARFFENELPRKVKEYISTKEETSFEISKLYKSAACLEPTAHKDRQRLKDELLRLTERRQIINTLERLEKQIDTTKFCYISMLTMILSQLAKYCVENPEALDDSKYRPLVEVVNNWCQSHHIDQDYMNKIYNTLKGTHSTSNKAIDIDVVDYYKKVSQLRHNVKRCLNDDNHKYFELMQDLGNNLRRCGKPCDESVDMAGGKYLTVLSEEAAQLVKCMREKGKKKAGRNGARTYFVIECFRNPEEIQYFRKRFSSFYVFAISADEQTRHKRAEVQHNLNSEACYEIDKRDQGKESKDQTTQNVRHCVNLADIALTNSDNDEKKHLYDSLIKYFAAIKDPGCIKPTPAEQYMNLAYSLSLSSTCICRQVGAVIVHKGYVIGCGWNDTDPTRIGCIYRHREDVSNTDSESFPLGELSKYEELKSSIVASGNNHHPNFCYKDEYKNVNEEVDKTQACRALHAEENAILQLANIGGEMLCDATIYVTTYPCGICAKKILQAGIGHIVYCEPYPSLISKEVFFKEAFSPPEIRAFEGVKSPSFFRLFKASMDIKDRQELMQINGASKCNKGKKKSDGKVCLVR